MGHVISADGLSPDQTKVTTINALKQPTNVKELRSFLGMITYCTSFLPNLATYTEPLHMLIKKNTNWIWTSEHQAVFEHLKSLLTSAQTLALSIH